MSMEINKYSQFYQGAGAFYGCGQDALMPSKDTVVHHEFSTTDEQGNKVMDKMTKEETLAAMKEVSDRYGDHVLVIFSGDGMAALVEAKKGQLDRPLTETELAAKEQREKVLADSIVHLDNTYHQIIPNIQTNDKLEKGLQGADKRTADTAYRIINQYMLKSSVGDMSDGERLDGIAFGLESAKYLAKNYLDETHAALFMEAMENIARYAVNGTVSDGGKVTYKIERGPLVGAPDSYVNTYETLKDRAPDLYRQKQALDEKIRKGESGWGREMIELWKKLAPVLNASDEEAIRQYADWKKTIENTKLPDTFTGVEYSDMQSFFESLKGQSVLSDAWLDENVQKLAQWLG